MAVEARGSRFTVGLPAASVVAVGRGGLGLVGSGQNHQPPHTCLSVDLREEQCTHLRLLVVPMGHIGIHWFGQNSYALKDAADDSAD